MSSITSTTFVYHIEKSSVSPKEAIDCIKGLSNAITETHKAMFPEQDPIDVRIKPIEKGSSEFIFDILNHLWENKDLVGTIGTLASTQDIIYVLEFLGLIKGGSPINLREILANGFSVEKDQNGKITKIEISKINISITLPAVISFFNKGTINVVQNLQSGLVIESKHKPSSGYIKELKHETENIIDDEYKKIWL